MIFYMISIFLILWSYVLWPGILWFILNNVLCVQEKNVLSFFWDSNTISCICSFNSIVFLLNFCLIGLFVERQWYVGDFNYFCVAIFINSCFKYSDVLSLVPSHNEELTCKDCIIWYNYITEQEFLHLKVKTEHDEARLLGFLFYCQSGCLWGLGKW